MRSERRTDSDQHSVRDLRLLEGERVEERFIPHDGVVPDIPRKGELLVLTNHRVITFVQSSGHRQAFFAPLEEMKGVSVKANTRDMKNLSQGLIMTIVGILAYLLIGYAMDSWTIGLVLGGAIVFVGVLFIARYFFWEEEEEGTITFQGGSWELSFPYKSNKAGASVYNLVNRFFQLRLGINGHTAPQPSAGECPLDDQPYEVPCAPPPEDYALGSHISEDGTLDGTPHEQQPAFSVSEDGSLDSTPYEQEPGPSVSEDGSLDGTPHEQQPGPSVSEDGSLDSTPYEQQPGPSVSEDGSPDGTPHEQQPGPPVSEDGPDSRRSF